MNDSEDWDEDFTAPLKVMQVTSEVSQKVAVVGLQANQFDKEEYDDDLDFGEAVGVKQPAEPVVEDEEDWDADILGSDSKDYRQQMQSNLKAELMAEQFEQPSLESTFYHYTNRIKQKIEVQVTKYPKAISPWSLDVHVLETQMSEYLLGFSQVQEREDALLAQFTDAYRSKQVYQCQELAYNIIQLGNVWLTLKTLSRLCRLQPFHQLPIFTAPIIQKQLTLKYLVQLLAIQSSVHHQRNIIVNEHELCQLFDVVSRDKQCQDQNLLKLAVLVDLQCLNFGVNPLTCETMNIEDLDDDDSETYSIIHDQKRIAVDSEFRYKEIVGYYKNCPVSYVKSKAAYIMALYELHELSSPQAAEQLAFECLVMLKQQDDQSLVSSLAYNALKLLWEVLVVNKKELYAVYACVSSLVNMQMRQKQVTLSQYTSLAQMCSESGQYEEASKWYNVALKLCQDEKKFNEYQHIQNIYAEVLVKSGEGSKSLVLLKDSVLYFSQLYTKDSYNSQLVSNYIATAIQYFKGLAVSGQVDQCILQAEKMLIDQSLQTYDVSEVVILLAKCYRKKGWTWDCLEILVSGSFLGNDPTVLQILLQSDINGELKQVGKLKALKLASDTQFKVDLVKQASKCLLLLNRPAEGLQLLDRYLPQTDLLGLRVRLMYKMYQMKLAPFAKDPTEPQLKKSSFSASHLLASGRFSIRKGSSTLPAKIAEQMSSNVALDGSAVTLKSCFDLLDRASDPKIKRLKIGLYIDSIAPLVLFDKLQVQEAERQVGILYEQSDLLALLQQCLDYSFKNYQLSHIATDYAHTSLLLQLFQKQDRSLVYWQLCYEFTHKYVNDSVQKCKILMKLCMAMVTMQELPLLQSNVALLMEVIEQELQVKAEGGFSIYQRTKKSRKAKATMVVDVESPQNSLHNDFSALHKSLSDVHLEKETSTDSEEHSNPSTDSLSNSRQSSQHQQEIKQSLQLLALDDALVSLRLLQKWNQGHITQVNMDRLICQVAVSKETVQLDITPLLLFIFDFQDHWCVVHPHSQTVKCFRMHAAQIQHADTVTSQLGVHHSLSQDLVQLKLCYSENGNTESFSIIELPSSYTLNDIIQKLVHRSPTQSTKKGFFDSTSSFGSRKSAASSSSSSKSGSARMNSNHSVKPQLSTVSDDLSSVVVTDTSVKGHKFISDVKENLIDLNGYVFATKGEHMGKISYYQLPWSAHVPVQEIPLLTRKDKSQFSLPVIYYLPSKNVSIPHNEVLEQRQNDTLELIDMFIKTGKPIMEDNTKSSKFQQIVKEIRMSAFPRLEASLQTEIVQLFSSVRCFAYPWELVFQQLKPVRQMPLDKQPIVLSRESAPKVQLYAFYDTTLDTKLTSWLWRNKLF